MQDIMKCTSRARGFG